MGKTLKFQNVDNVEASDVRLLSKKTEEKVHCLIGALASMDARIELELSKLEQSAADEGLKEFIKQDTLARHSERRLPYVHMLMELKDQHHQPSIA
jgi:hypothetical protein